MSPEWRHYRTECEQLFAILNPYRRVLRRVGISEGTSDALAFFFATGHMYEQPWRGGIPGNNPGGLSSVGDRGSWTSRGYRLGIFSSLDAYAEAAYRVWARPLSWIGGPDAALRHPQATQVLANYWRYGRRSATDTPYSAAIRRTYNRFARMCLRAGQPRSQRATVPQPDAGHVLLGYTDRRTGRIKVNWTGDPKLDLETLVHEAYHAGVSRCSLAEMPGEEADAEAFGVAEAARYLARYGG